MILICLVNIALCQNANPISGSPYNYGKVSRVLSGAFFEKNQTNTWNLSFIKPDYLVELKYQTVTSERFKNRSIVADLMLAYPDGQRFYYSRKGTSVFLTSAIISTEITKTGFMLVEFDGGKPLHFTEKSNNQKFSAKVRLEKSELTATYATLFPYVDAVQFKVDYNVSKVTSESGALEINNIKPKVVRYKTFLQANGSVQVESRGQTKDVTFRITNWPKYFKSDLIWGNFELINFYADAFIDPIISYKIKDNTIRELRCQISPAESSLFGQDDKGVIAYPNPSPGEVFLDLINYPKGQYRVEIYNLVGFKVKTINFDENENTGLKIDLTGLRPSMYSYTVFDSNGRRIASKRINLISS